MNLTSFGPAAVHGRKFSTIRTVVDYCQVLPRDTF